MLGMRAIDNRVRKLKELEAQAKELENQMNSIKQELKAELEERGTDEIRTSAFVLRWKEIESCHFLTAKFRAEHERLYSKYIEKNVSKRFTTTKVSA